MSAAFRPPAGPVTLRQLNRSLLARQLLLARQRLPVPDAVGRIFALQAQLARPPHLALWSRLADYASADLNAAVQTRTLVRVTMMRGTLFLLNAKDYLALRSTLQPVLTAAMEGPLKDKLVHLDPAATVQAAEALLAERPLTFEALRPMLKARFPKADERALGHAVRTHLPLAQVPDDSPWGYPAAAAFTPARAWLGKPVAARTDLPALILRYLAAFGPATPGDFQNWSGLKDVRATFEALRPKLHTVQDGRGRELFDVPDAPWPEEDSPAPVRFLPEFDSAIQAHADRQRIVPEAYKPHIQTRNLRVPPTVLVDGFLAGSWALEARKTRAVVRVTPFARWTKALQREVEAEGLALARFAAPESRAHELRIGAQP